MFNTTTKFIVGSVIVAAVVVLAVAFWPDSDADKARADGEQFGAAVTELTNAGSTAEVEAAQAEIRAAAEETRTHAGDQIADQAADQADALDRAVDGYVGAVSAESDWDYELYELELEVALDDLSDNAAEFREQGPDLQQAFWDGFEEGRSAA